MLAGMNAVAHAELVAAVANAGGMGTIGGLLLSPKALKKEIDEAKALMTDKVNPKFGVDLAIPQIGGGAQANHDYTHGQLPGDRHCRGARLPLRVRHRCAAALGRRQASRRG